MLTSLWEEISEGQIPETTIHIYIVNEKLMSWCKEYFKIHTDETWNFTQAMEDTPNFGFGYLEGQFNRTFEEYNKLRMELEING